MLTLVEDGEIYDPAPRGTQAVLLAYDRILHIGAVDRAALLGLNLDCQVIDARGCLVLPGLIDPHEHLIGAGGEEGFATRRPEVSASAILAAGITTVVGCLGTDTITRHLSALLAKAHQLEAQGLSTYIYTGGWQLPPATLSASLAEDLVLIDKVIGVGELAIADERSLEPSLDELARAVSAATIGGRLSGKAGVIHFHLGPGKRRLALLHELLERYDIAPEQLYPTHITRSQQLLDEAIALARRGAYVDIDTVEQGLGHWLRYYWEHGGPRDRLTVSSDAQTAGASPGRLYQELVASVQQHGFALEELLPLFTSNPASALKLQRKGRLQQGYDADLLVVDSQSLAVVHVIARGRQLVRDGRPLVEEDATA